jgi:hypothetical protein
MAKVSPPKDRSTISDTAAGVLVATPARKSWFILLFMPVWLIGWAVGGVSAASELLSTNAMAGEQQLFLIAWLALWTVFGLLALVLFLWTLIGIEAITVGSQSVTIRRYVLGLGPTREYDLSHIRRLRVASDSFNFFDPRMALRFWGLGGGPIAFDYGSATIRFGGGVDEAEANRIVATIINRFPSIARNDA